MISCNFKSISLFAEKASHHTNYKFLYPICPDGNFKPPDDNFKTPDDNLKSPDDNFKSPDGNFKPPDGNFKSPDGNFKSPDGNFKPPDDNFKPPDDNFKPPGDNFKSPDDNFKSPDDKKMVKNAVLRLFSAIIINKYHIINKLRGNTMTNHQSNKLTMYNTVQTYLRSKQNILDTLPAFETLLGGFEEKIQEINELEAKREIIKAGKNANKLQEEKEVVETTFKVMAALNVYASVTGNNELMQSTGYTQSDLQYVLRDNELLEKAYAVYNSAAANVAELADYGLTEADIEAVKTNADEFAEAMGIVGSSTAESKTATQSFKQLFDKADDILYKRIDKLVDVIKKNQPEFYDEYRNARNIIDR